MVYITTRQNQVQTRQLSFDEMCFGGLDIHNEYRDNITNNTRTFKTENVPEKYLYSINVQELINQLEFFNNSTEALRRERRESLYRSYRIPKRSGGSRPIDEPLPPLMTALKNLKMLFEFNFRALHHTSAFAYVSKRATIDCARRHQYNESKWYGKFDLTNFFGSTTLEFAMRMLSMVFPFSEVMKNPQGERELTKAIELGFLRGGLPQGSPLSPTLTNYIMVPFDHEFTSIIRRYNRQNYVYTRWADDFIISSKYEFSTREIIDLIEGVLRSLDAPYRINRDKTRYGNTSFSNWVLGLNINADNNITVGYKFKKKLARDLFNYAADRNAGTPWDYGRIKKLDGDFNYAHSIEPQYFDELIQRVSNKCDLDIKAAIRADTKV